VVRGRVRFEYFGTPTIRFRRINLNINPRNKFFVPFILRPKAMLDQSVDGRKKIEFSWETEYL
jgi:hypothetical protein